LKKLVAADLGFGSFHFTFFASGTGRPQKSAVKKLEKAVDASFRYDNFLQSLRRHRLDGRGSSDKVAANLTKV
jgi:hypothetical protein